MLLKLLLVSFISSLAGNSDRLSPHYHCRLLTFTKESDPVSPHFGWRGFKTFSWLD